MGTNGVGVEWFIAVSKNCKIANVIRSGTGDEIPRRKAGNDYVLVWVIGTLTTFFLVVHFLLYALRRKSHQAHASPTPLPLSKKLNPVTKVVRSYRPTYIYFCVPSALRATPTPTLKTTSAPTHSSAFNYDIFQWKFHYNIDFALFENVQLDWIFVVIGWQKIPIGQACWSK